MGCTSSRNLNVVAGTSNQSTRRQREDANHNNAGSRDQAPLFVHMPPAVGLNESWMRAHGYPFGEAFAEEGQYSRRGVFRRNRRTASSEIMELQQSLEAMELFFQTLLGQTSIFMEAMDPNSGTGAGPPPASESEMAILQRTSLQKHELKSHNKLCVICCEPYTMGEIVTRLPCSHFFHPHCVEPWLHRHCTCPTCRYELATDDDDYEKGRIERMKTRTTNNIKDGSPLNACSTEEESDECPSDEEVAAFKAFWDDTSQHQADDLLVIDELEDSRSYNDASDEENSLDECLTFAKESEIDHENLYRSQSTGRPTSGDDAETHATTGRERTASIALGDCCISEDGGFDTSTEPAEVLRADGSLALPDAR